MISKEEILNLATLARLELSEAEVAGLQKDISNILDYVGQVNAVSPEADQGSTFTQGSPRSNLGVPPLHNVMREDVPRAADDLLAGKEETLRAAFPKREGGYNVVRKIIQKDE